MKTLITIILLSTINLFAAEPPEIEEFKLKGYEDYNFNNVLLDPMSPIEDFYLITDIGEILKVENMGHFPEVQKVFMYDGQITEAESEGETHYFSVVGESETMLLATTDFMNLDTVYQEDNAEITDFRLDRGRLYILSNNGTDGKISYTPIGESNWEEKSIPDYKYNRLFVMDSLMIVFKYLAGDVTVYKSNIDTDWELSKQLEQFNKNIADFEKININTLSVYGDIIITEGNRILFVDNELNYSTFSFGAIGINKIVDLALENDFDIKKNSEMMQSGYYTNECECAYLHKFSFNGDGTNNRHLFLQTKSLNKIKSNKRAKNIQFVAVGTDGLVLLINRSKTSVEDDQKQELTIDENANFTIYPNPVGKEKEIVVESKEIINTITITDISGKQSMNIHQVGKMSYRVPISNIASGVYFITVNGVSKQFVVE